MWLLILLLTIILWFFVDNIVIAGILAMFSVYLYDKSRMLYQIKQYEKEQLRSHNGAEDTQGQHPSSEVNPSVQSHQLDRD